MSTPSKRRLMRDFRMMQTDPPYGITAAPLEDDIMQWQAVMFGPDDSPWEGGTFKLSLAFTSDYPNKAPTVKFVTPMFHPNIYADGSICLDILQQNWSPIYHIAAVLTSIQSLLTDPNPNSPANVEAAKLYQENRREYERRVQQVVESTWNDDGSDEESDSSDDDDDDEDDSDSDDEDEGNEDATEEGKAAEGTASAAASSSSSSSSSTATALSAGDAGVKDPSTSAVSASSGDSEMRSAANSGDVSTS